MDPEFVDEERIPLTQTSYDNTPYNDTLYGETSFNRDDTAAQSAKPQDDLAEPLGNVDTQIKALERNFNIKIPSEECGRFRIITGYLQVEKNPGEYVNVTKSSGEFLASTSTLRTRLGATLARTLLGIETPALVKTRSRLILENLPTEIEMEDLFSKKY